MLRELSIKNFAIIDQLRVEFGPGLNVFTGETGAGKSIVVDALNLALGERASADLIRTGCDEAVVEAAFELNGAGSAAVAALLADQGIALEPGEDLVVRRVISSAGKNKVYLNGSLSTLSALAQAGSLLADIHGQHEHQSLLSPEQQLEMLDAFGGHGAEREAVLREYGRLQQLRAELSEMETGEREKAQREDLLRHQVNEIGAARLAEGEDERLAEEQRLLANAEKLSNLARSADEALYSGEGAALGALKRGMTAVRDIAGIDARLAPVLELLESGRAQIDEAAREIASYADRVDVDPQRLEEIGDRLDLIQKLKKKYGGSIADINAFGEKAAEDLRKIERSSEEIARLRNGIEAARSALTAAVRTLSKKRKSAAAEMERKVVSELGHLGMKKTVFAVRLTQEAGEDTTDGLKSGPRGADRIEYLIAPNPGEELRSLARIASGGELSRIMLALKTILAAADNIPTLVFDEVDAGIGGAVAEEVGRKLRKIADKRQVFCITHLPQIASLASSHFGVSKNVRQERTATEVRLLAKEERVEEIARMLGGRTITDATLKHAVEMIEGGTA